MSVCRKSDSRGQDLAEVSDKPTGMQKETDNQIGMLEKKTNQ